MTPVTWATLVILVALIISITVLTALHDTVPSVLPDALIGTLVGHFGITLPAQAPK